MKKRFSKSVCNTVANIPEARAKGFFPKNCCPPHSSLHIPNIHHPHLLCPVKSNTSSIPFSTPSSLDLHLHLHLHHHRHHHHHLHLSHLHYPHHLHFFHQLHLYDMLYLQHIHYLHHHHHLHHYILYITHITHITCIFCTIFPTSSSSLIPSPYY